MLRMQIESQAVETAQMLEKFEGSVAALREIERQYGQLQVLSPLALCRCIDSSCKNVDACLYWQATPQYQL